MTISKVRWDKEANAAYLAFSAIADGESAKQFPVKNKQGEVLAVLDFAASGELLGIELLNAKDQLPAAFRD